MNGKNACEADPEDNLNNVNVEISTSQFAIRQKRAYTATVGRAGFGGATSSGAFASSFAVTWTE